MKIIKYAHLSVLLYIVNNKYKFEKGTLLCVVFFFLHSRIWVCLRPVFDFFHVHVSRILTRARTRDTLPPEIRFNN